MAHSYTPGLKVLHYTVLKKNRRLPIKGDVKKSKGDKVNADDVIAKTDLPGNVNMLKVANLLNISPADIHDVLMIKEGDSVNEGDLIAQTDGLFGFFKSFKLEANKASVRATIINPGMVRTSFFDNLNFVPGSSKENAIEAKDIAEIIYFLSKSSKYINISDINIDTMKKVIVKK